MKERKLLGKNDWVCYINVERWTHIHTFTIKSYIYSCSQSSRWKRFAVWINQVAFAQVFFSLPLRRDDYTEQSSRMASIIWLFLISIWVTDWCECQRQFADLHIKSKVKLYMLQDSHRKSGNRIFAPWMKIQRNRAQKIKSFRKRFIKCQTFSFSFSLPFIQIFVSYSAVKSIFTAFKWN